MIAATDVVYSRMLALSLALLIAGPARADDCVTTYHITDIEQALSDAESAYAARNRDSVHSNVALALDRLRCVADEVNSAAAARIHRAVGLDGVVMKDDTRAVSAFLAARTIEPSYDYTAAMAPDGSTLRTDYTNAKPTAAAAATPLTIPANLKVRIDGASATERPSGRPAVIQAFDPAGLALSGWYTSDSPLALPEARAAIEPDRAVSSLTTVARPKGPNRPLLYSALGAVAAGGVLYGAAWASHDAYEKADLADQPGIADANHVETIAAFSLVGAGATVGLLAVVVGSW